MQGSSRQPVRGCKFTIGELRVYPVPFILLLEPLHLDREITNLHTLDSDLKADAASFHLLCLSIPISISLLLFILFLRISLLRPVWTAGSFRFQIAGMTSRLCQACCDLDSQRQKGLNKHTNAS